jgi:hypothetical protein
MPSTSVHAAAVRPGAYRIHEPRMDGEHGADVSCNWFESCLGQIGARRASHERVLDEAQLVAYVVPCSAAGSSIIERACWVTTIIRAPIRSHADRMRSRFPR